MALRTLSNYDENTTIVSSKRKILLFDLNHKKMSRKYTIRETGNIIGAFKNNKYVINHEYYIYIYFFIIYFCFYNKCFNCWSGQWNGGG